VWVQTLDFNGGGREHDNASQETALKRVLPVLQETARSMRLLL